MSTLRERVDRLREAFTAQVPAEIKAVMKIDGECKTMKKVFHLRTRGKSGSGERGIFNRERIR